MSRKITAKTGLELECKGWEQEAALRMLYNNLDPEVADRPEDLVVYGGIGRGLLLRLRPCSPSPGSPRRAPRP